MPSASNPIEPQNINLSNPSTFNSSITNMATVLTPAIETRDLRSARKEWKRGKDSSIKWSHGARHLPGVRCSAFDCLPSDKIYPDNIPAKARPRKRPSDFTHPKNSSNPTKMRPSWSIPDARIRSKLHAQTEIRDADPDVPSTPSASLAALDSPSLSQVYFSFDRSDSPDRPVTLEMFVTKSGKKKTGGLVSETERLVEREYEVVDGKGEAVRGRRARGLLRREGSKEREEGKEDEGFELV